MGFKFAGKAPVAGDLGDMATIHPASYQLPLAFHKEFNITGCQPSVLVPQVRPFKISNLEFQI